MISGWPSARVGASRYCLSKPAVLPMSSSVIHSSVCQRATRVLGTPADVTPAFRRGVCRLHQVTRAGPRCRHPMHHAVQSHAHGDQVWSLIGCVWCSASSAWRLIRLRHSPAPACTGPRGRWSNTADFGVRLHRISAAPWRQAIGLSHAPSSLSAFSLGISCENFAQNRIGSQPPSGYLAAE